MTYETIEVEPITPVIGAEISGVDISKPLGNQTYQEIHNALMKHQVIFFRDQDMSLDEHKNFGRLFGELHIHPLRKRRMDIRKSLLSMQTKKSKVVAGMKWHSDVSCDLEPPMGSILHYIPFRIPAEIPCSQADMRRMRHCPSRSRRWCPD